MLCNKNNFYIKPGHIFVYGLISVLCILPNFADAAVAKRGTTSARSAIAKKPEPEIVVENKTSQFDDFMSEMDSVTGSDNDDALAESIRAQRAAFTAQSNRNAAASAAQSAASSNTNECDKKLRACMQNKCGNDFTKCSGDTDTTWGDKLDACRRDTTCTGEEYRLFTTEIKADRDSNAEMSLYNSIINCGNSYNNCIITQCGPTFAKCLGKKSGDAAIEKCKTIAQDCKEQDSGLASRAMSVFGGLRTDAEKTVAQNEKRLYELRDLMRDTCTRLGAMFDDRTLDCVYSIEFYAGEDNTLYASKKAYAGSTFSCTPNWFGIDITTFMENAQRTTRAQTAASSAMLGSGLGIGVGAVTSGAIDRAVDRKKADDELHEALCNKTGGTWRKTLKSCNCPKGQKFDKEEGCIDRKRAGTNQDADDAPEIPEAPSGDDNGLQGPPALSASTPNNSSGSVDGAPTTDKNKNFGTDVKSDVLKSTTNTKGYDYSKSAMDNATSSVTKDYKIGGSDSSSSKSVSSRSNTSFRVDAATGKSISSGSTSSSSGPKKMSGSGGFGVNALTGK